MGFRCTAIGKWLESVNAGVVRPRFVEQDDPVEIPSEALGIDFSLTLDDLWGFVGH